MRKKRQHYLLLFIILFLSSCSPYFNQPVRTEPARLGPETVQNKELSSLPKPMEPIVAAVYKFRDQTGQYKPSETGASWSTAVTQGATTILLRALEESKWFVPIERENIGNLLNERKIIRSSRQHYLKDGEQTSSSLPPLLFAGVILEGGIISYETNILTGGAGARYFGAGASNQYRQDRVSVYLRAVSSSNGKILKTVYTTKTILSQAVDVGFFAFVKFKRLLEVETGFTYNEPSEMAVTEAIEKAVYSLILEGTMDGLWSFANPEEMGGAVINQYKEEKSQNEKIDDFGNDRYLPIRGQFSVGMNGGVTLYDGDYPDPKLAPLVEAELDFLLKPAISLNLLIGGARLKTANAYEAGINYAAFGFKVKPLPHDMLTPYFFLDGGIMMEDRNVSEFSEDQPYPWLTTGLGMEYMLNERLGVNLGLNYNYIFDDDFDGIRHGKLNDLYWGGRVGVTFYLGQKL